mmetsp:Transcript_21474/g.48365  ORF Transcript_21474/g.48365 Transcript_21474/m.48365 type:complete len:290 (+) Transcript_21474:1405-2274(+)
MPSHRSLGVQLFRDYVRAFHIVDPWLISNYLAGDNEVAAYERLTQGAEIDSSVVVIDTVRAWRYVHVVAALNWWKAIIDRHAWGDKDTWALAALVLQAADGTVDGVASTVGSTVGWLGNTATEPPAAIWGHVQFSLSGVPYVDEPRGIVSIPLGMAGRNNSRLLYLNWQPHYAAGFIRMEGRGRPSDDLYCCVMLEDHWAGPHNEDWVTPRNDRLMHAADLDRTFGDARTALRALGVTPRKAHWRGQVRYRRCFIYFSVLGLGCALLAWSVTRAVLLRHQMASRVRDAV